MESPRTKRSAISPGARPSALCSTLLMFCWKSLVTDGAVTS